MKLRIRQLANSHWIVEAGSWIRPWKAVRIEKITTRGSADLGKFDLPILKLEKPGSNHYPLTWHLTKESALVMMTEARALLGQ